MIDPNIHAKAMEDLHTALVEKAELVEALEEAIIYIESYAFTPAGNRERKVNELKETLRRVKG